MVQPQVVPVMPSDTATDSYMHNRPQALGTDLCPFVQIYMKFYATFIYILLISSLVAVIPRNRLN